MLSLLYMAILGIGRLSALRALLGVACGGLMANRT